MKHLCADYSQIRNYLSYQLRAKTKWSIHSPFVYELVTSVLNDKFVYPEYKFIESACKRCFKSHSEKPDRTQRKINRLIFRLARHYTPPEILFFPTTGSLAPFYAAKALPGTLIRLPINNFQAMKPMIEEARITGVDNMEIFAVHEDTCKGGQIDSKASPVLVIFGEPANQKTLIEYSTKLIPQLHNDSMIVVIGINSNSEAAQNWKWLCAQPQTTLTINLFHLGIVFIRKESTKQDFIIRF